jgi:hypothetical protein
MISLLHSPSKVFIQFALLLKQNRESNSDSLGARIYFYRAILHDWSDDECRKILGNTVQAMDKDYSTLLINEYVLPNTGADLHPASLDLTMMSLFSGMERTESHWHTLLNLVGLDIVKIWPGTDSVIEAKKKV